MLPVKPVCPIGMLHRWGLPSLFISERTGSGLASKSRRRRDLTFHTHYILVLWSAWLKKPPQVLMFLIPASTPGSFRHPRPVRYRTALFTSEVVWKVGDSDWKVNTHGEPLFDWPVMSDTMRNIYGRANRIIFLTLICFFCSWSVIHSF